MPHDQVIDLDSAGSATVTAIRTQYFISRNNGLTWERQTRGITCPWNIEHTHRAVGISPAFEQDGIAFLTCSNRLFVSRDGGTSYSEAARAPRGDFADLFVAHDFAFEGKVMALLSDGTVVSSSDTGKTWTNVEGLDDITVLGGEGGQILAGDAGGALHLSQDNGSNWKTFENAAETALTGFAFPYGTDLSQRFYAASASSGVLELKIDGSGLSTRPAGLEADRITSLAFSASGENALLFATTWDGRVLRSADMGAVWEDSSRDLQTAKQADKYKQPQFTFIHTLSDDTLLVGAFSGLYRSEDAGDTWLRLDTTIGYINAVATSPAEGNSYEVAVSTYANGILRSRDTGKTWTFDQSGLLVRRLSLEYGPDTGGEHRLFSGTYNRMEFAAGDGSSWSYVSLRDLESLYDQANSPVGAASIRVSPDFDSDGTVFVGMFPHGVLRSTDSGRSFDVVLDGEGPSWSLAMSPDFDTDGTVFANVAGSVHRSTDGGDTWSRLWGLDIDRFDLAISNAFATDRTVFAAGDAGVFRSRNAGETWEEIALPGKTKRVVGLAVSSSYDADGLVYVQVAGDDLLVGRDEGDRFEWRHAVTPAPGHEFSKLAGQDGYDLFAFSPFFSEDRTMYGGAGRYLLRSTDAGATWDLMPTLPRRFEAEHAVMDFFHVPMVLSGPWKSQTPETRTKALRARMGDMWRKLFGGLRQIYGNNSGLGALDSDAAGATLTVDFVGEGVRVLGTKGPDHGMVDIYLNGTLQETVDLYAPRMEYQAELLVDRELGLGGHRLRLEVKGESNRQSSGTRVGIDAIDTFY